MISFRRVVHRHFSTHSFAPPPAASIRRVVVTGLGMVTPLGSGVEAAWRRLLEGRCGIRSLEPSDLKMDNFDEDVVSHVYEQLGSKVAAVVPCGKGEGEFDDEFWKKSQDQRSIARFITYAVCSAEEALRDANWMPSEMEKKERTGVSIGGGTGSVSDIVDAAKLICEKVKLVQQLPTK